MNKNKGFTLIELLAAIVILGILIGVSVPLLINMLDTSRNKMYVNDAKKLVTEAEYKIRANNSKIEKPNEGDCIIISLLYLDSSVFDNPPNDGTYDKESSYVVIKNNGGKLEYSVTLIEKFRHNGGYKGVELTKDAELISSNALSHVVSFDASDIKKAGSVDKSYINSKLGSDYISSEGTISKVYNQSE